jgi:hypothetical protein
MFIVLHCAGLARFIAAKGFFGKIVAVHGIGPSPTTSANA